MKPGDLCLVVGSFKTPQNVGKTVTLIQLIGREERFRQAGLVSGLNTGLPIWAAEGEGLMGVVFSHGEYTIQPVRTGMFTPEELMPLKKDDDTLAVTTKIVQGEPA